MSEWDSAITIFYVEIYGNFGKQNNSCKTMFNYLTLYYLIFATYVFVIILPTYSAFIKLAVFMSLVKF